jgi:hypothetical protein
MDTRTKTQSAAQAARGRAERLGHTIGAWRLDHHESQAHAECILCGEQLGVLALERAVIGGARRAATFDRRRAARSRRRLCGNTDVAATRRQRRNRHDGGRSKESFNSRSRSHEAA